MFLVAQYNTYNEGLDEPFRYVGAADTQMLAARLASVFDPDNDKDTDTQIVPADPSIFHTWAAEQWDEQVKVVDLDQFLPGPEHNRRQLAMFSIDPHLDLEGVYGGLDSVAVERVLDGLDLQAINVDWLEEPAWRNAYISATTVFDPDGADPAWRRSRVDELMLDADLTRNQQIAVAPVRIRDPQLAHDLAEPLDQNLVGPEGVTTIWLAASYRGLTAAAESQNLAHDAGALAETLQQTVDHHRAGVGVGLSPRDALRDANLMFTVDGQVHYDTRPLLVDAAKAGTAAMGQVDVPSLPPLGLIAQVDLGCKVLQIGNDALDSDGYRCNRDDEAQRATLRFALGGRAGQPWEMAYPSADSAWQRAWDTFTQCRHRLSDATLANAVGGALTPADARRLEVTKIGEGNLFVASVGEPVSATDAAQRATGIGASPRQAIRQTGTADPTVPARRHNLRRAIEQTETPGQPGPTPETPTPTLTTLDIPM